MYPSFNTKILVKILRRAAFESKILRLCDFENPNDQGGICRRDPAPPPPRDILQKTVYLEGLPKDATVQWLKVEFYIRRQLYFNFEFRIW